MTVQNTIESKLTQSLAPLHMEVLNESHQHNVPPGSESHFKVTVVSQEFEGKMLVARHRIINKILADELAGPIHALSMHTFTESEWTAKNAETRPSPPCLGGSKRG